MKFLALICMVGLAGGGWKMIQPNPVVRSEVIAAAGLGFVRPDGADVRIRSEGQASWTQVVRDADVFKNDHIFTGATSGAQVQLKATGTFRIEPSSLIVLSEDGTSTFGVETGSFLAEVERGAHFVIHSHDQRIEIASDGATLRLESREGQKLKVAILRGDATVTTARALAPRLLMANEVAVIEQDQLTVTPLMITPTAPGPGETVWNTDQLVHFEWSILNAGDLEGKTAMRLEISRDPLFKLDTFKTVVNGASFDHALKSGIYFWRVRAVDDRGFTSPTSSFTLYDLRAPMVEKTTELNLAMDWRGQAVDPAPLSWRDPSYSETYDVRVSATEDFARIEYAETTRRSQINLKHLGRGTHYWQVTSKHAGRADLTSETGLITLSAPAKTSSEPKPEPVAPPAEQPTLAVVTPPPPPVAPKPAPVAARPKSLSVNILSPEHEQVITAATGTPAEVTFGWDIRGDYDLVRFKLKRGKRLRTVVKVEDVTEISSLVESIERDGRYQWSIDALNSSTGERTRAEGLFVVAHADVPDVVPEVTPEPTPNVAAPLLTEAPIKEIPRSPASVEDPAPARDVTEVTEATATVTSTDVDPADVRRWMSIGGGVTKVDGFASGTRPYVGMHGGYDVGDFGIEGNLTRAGAGVGAGGDVTWQTTSVEGKYRLFKQTDEVGRGLQAHVRLGLQYQQLPRAFVVGDHLEYAERDLGSASVGFDARYVSGHGLRYETAVRYQVPILDSGPRSWFDVVAGADHVFANQLTLGAFWHGQVQDFRYLNGGSRPLTVSNFELRLGYEF